MKNLRQLAKVRNEILGRIYDLGGELTPELESLLSISSDNQAEKVDQTKYVLDLLDKDESYLKEKAEEYSTAAKRIHNAKKRIKSSLVFVMKELNLKEIQGNDYKFKLVNTIGRLVIDDEEKVPQEFKTVVQEAVIDNDRLKGEILLGRDIPGAHVENGSSVRSYLSRRKETNE